MAASTNGRWHPPAPAISIVESTIPEGMTVGEYRRSRPLANTRPWWRRFV